jgi:hypothetical protein
MYLENYEFKRLDLVMKWTHEFLKVIAWLPFII